MTANKRAEMILQDILANHLPRIVEGLKAGYIDENQILVMYDHAVRARVFKEQNAKLELLVDELKAIRSMCQEGLAYCQALIEPEPVQSANLALQSRIIQDCFIRIREKTVTAEQTQ